MQNPKLVALSAVVLSVFAIPCRAQQPTTAPDDVAQLRKQLANVLSRLEALEAKHAQEHDADQQQIAALQAKVQQLQDNTLDADRARVLAEMADQLRSQLPQSGDTADQTFELAPSAGSSTNLLNPAVTVFVDLGGSVSSRGRNNALNRFNLRETELDLRAAVSPFADGVMIITIAEDIQSRRDGNIDVSREFDIEEGYVNFHTLPGGLSLKVGKFRNAFGRNNPLHTHDLPQVTRPLAIVKFFGPEGLDTTGASLTWLVPNPWDKYLELTGEFINADGGEASPLLGGPNAENPAVLGHLKYFDDVGENGSLELGSSFLFAKSSDEHSDFDGHTFGFDATYMWLHPDPSKFRSVLVQSEFLWSKNDVDRGPFRSDTHESVGFYAFGQYQLNRDWYAGLRYDFTQFPNSLTRDSDDEDWAITPYVSWYITEFMRLRGQYEHRVFRIDGNSSSEEAFFLQLTFLFGAHPPHPYWVNR